MANPALKNGYISIATELVEEFCRQNIPGNEMRIVWSVWRKTWGWKDGERHKDWDWISYSQFEKMTGMNRRSVGKSLKTLVGKRLLLKGEKGFKFNQNYEEWVVGKRLPPVVKRLLPSRQTATKTGRQTATHNRNKETITKETTANAGLTSKEEELRTLSWSIVSNFQERIKADFSFKPVVDISDYKAVKQFLVSFGESKVKDLLDYYYNSSGKYDDGKFAKRPRIAFSADTINKWQANK